MQSFEDNFSEEDSIEISVEYAVAYEKLLQMLKYANVIIVEFCGQKLEMYLKKPVFRNIRKTGRLDRSQDFYFAL